MSLQRLDCTALSVNHLFLIARIDRYMLYGRQLSSRGKMFALGVPEGHMFCACKNLLSCL